MGGGGGSPAEAGVGNGDDLGRSVVPVGVGDVGADDDPGAVLVVPLAHHQVLHPGDFGDAGESFHVGEVAVDHDDAALGGEHLYAGGGDGRRHGCGVGTPLDPYPVHPVGGEVGGQLGLLRVGRHRDDAGDTGNGGRGIGSDADLVGEVGNVRHEVGTSEAEGVDLGLLDGAIELHQVEAAAVPVERHLVVGGGAGTGDAGDSSEQEREHDEQAYRVAQGHEGPSPFRDPFGGESPGQSPRRIASPMSGLSPTGAGCHRAGRCLVLGTWSRPGRDRSVAARPAVRWWPDTRFQVPSTPHGASPVSIRRGTTLTAPC